MAEEGFEVHLVDGTYELFRQFFGRPEPGTYGATAGVLRSTLALIRGGATHVGVAVDHVIESFRNELWAGYKTSEGVDPAILSQIPVMEDALAAIGITVWPMSAHEADDALASAASLAAADPRVRRVLLCTADKDLGQCVGGKVFQWDRRNNVILDAAAVTAKFGVEPASLADWLALVGDSSDGFPGLPGWGAKTASAVLARYRRLEEIPRDGRWEVEVRGAARLARTLAENWEQALLFRHLATCVTDLDVGTVDSWRWGGPGPAAEAALEKLGSKGLREDLARTSAR